MTPTAASRPPAVATTFRRRARCGADFPILSERVHGKPLVYLDSANTSQKPQAVLDAMDDVLSPREREHPSRDTSAERARDGALRGGTREGRSVHQRARCAEHRPHQGDDRWHQPRRAELRPVDASARATRSSSPGWSITRTSSPGRCSASRPARCCAWCRSTTAARSTSTQYAALLSPRTRIVAMSHVSNALGTINPFGEIIEQAHARGAVVLIDGAQAVPHLAVDVQALDCDFYVFSSHKMFGPTGVGVLYGRRSLLEAMPPYQGGGDMIASVTFEKTALQRRAVQVRSGHAEHRRRRGVRRRDRLPDGASIGMPRSRTRMRCSSTRPRGCARFRRARIIGEARHKTGVLSFLLEGVHPHDAGTILDREGVAVRTGQHCAQPVMDPLRRHGDDSRIARHLQHARGNRRSGSRARARCARCSPDVGPDRPLPGSHPRP